MKATSAAIVPSAGKPGAADKALHQTLGIHWQISLNLSLKLRVKHVLCLECRRVIELVPMVKLRADTEPTLVGALWCRHCNDQRPVPNGFIICRYKQTAVEIKSEVEI